MSSNQYSKLSMGIKIVVLVVVYAIATAILSTMVWVFWNTVYPATNMTFWQSASVTLFYVLVSGIFSDFVKRIEGKRNKNT